MFLVIVEYKQQLPRLKTFQTKLEAEAFVMLYRHMDVVTCYETDESRAWQWPVGLIREPLPM